MIELRRIKKNFGSLEVLRGVDFDVNQGEILSIVGASGAGKTTLLQILGTLERPTSGTVSYDGTDPFALSGRRLAAFRNQTIGFVFQFHQLLPEFTTLENVAMPASSEVPDVPTHCDAPPKSSTILAWPTAPRTAQRSFPAASVSAQPWRVHSSTAPK